jgi:NADH-quinone oxidoreductase subunit J
LGHFTFYFFASCAILGAVLVALLPRLVQSAFALILALSGVAGLYWTLGADFLGGVQLLVYVGGIMILFLYGIMLTPKESSRWTLTSLLFPGVLCAVPVAILLYFGWTGLKAADPFLPVDQLPEPTATTETLGRWFLERESYLIPFELASVVLLVALVGSVYLARRREEA